MAYTAIDNPELYFQVKLYTGDGSTPSITLDGDEDMQPDMVWIKNRDAADSHCVFDAVRGVTEVLHADTNALEATDADTLTSFDSDGFAVGADVKVNTDTEKYVAWCWKESATAGFDIVSYEGTGSAHTEAHSLSAKPLVVIATNRERTSNWLVYHAAMDATGDYTLFLDSTSAKDNTQNYWGDTEATTSVFSVGDRLENNYSGEDIIAYCFAEKQGFSKFGSYTGNGNADGPFIYTGFKPAFVMIKSITVASWRIWDNKREDYAGNPNQTTLNANENNVDYDDASVIMDFLSNGFKIRVTGDNDAAEVITYMAFAEAPFVNSNGVPCNAR
jgi:hypothetical protein